MDRKIQHRQLGALLASLFLWAGCAKSPLLNHRQAGELVKSPGESGGAQGEKNEKCKVKFAKLDLCAEMEWKVQPTESEKGAFSLTFRKRSTGEIVGFDNKVGVKLWMPEHGHGSAPVKVLPAKNESGQVILGTFEATDVFFVMAGKWEIWIQIFEGKEIIDQGKVDYEF